MAVDIEKLKSMAPPKGMDFHIAKLGHIVLQVATWKDPPPFTPKFSVSKFPTCTPKR
jgi:hypothetical protein